MVAEKRHKKRSISFSLLSCFTGVTGQESNKPPPSYEKLTTAAPEAALSGHKKRPTIKLGGKAATARSHSLSAVQVVRPEAKGSTGLGVKVKEACEQVLEVAKKGTPHLSELFVGGQLFMHVTPAAHFGPKPCSKQTFSPSIGFLHMAAPAIDASLHER